MKKPNRVVAAMREGRKAYGYNIVFPSPWVVEILGILDFDFVWIDGEHGPFDLAAIEDMCRTAELYDVTPIARVPNIEQSTILRYLDRGVQGVIGPHICTGDDARQLARACYFGPLGERSFGGNRGTTYEVEFVNRQDDYKEANDNMLVGALLEDRASVENLDDILSVEGIDYFAIGLNDFAQGLGYPGQPDHPEVQRLFNETCERIRAAGKPMGNDFMVSDWMSNMLLGAGRKILES
jgi:4-hydroxy-2-oxoheptanedioate aldolase